MQRTIAVLAAVACVAMAWPASAQKDDSPGHGRGGPPDKAATGPGPGKGQGGGNPGHGQKAGAPQAQPAGAVVVPDRDRNTIQGYYRTQFMAGDCPPGLARKNNGCLPPGQARKPWTIGQPLPAGLVYAPLPAALIGQLAAPAGYEYIRVANDVLLMATGTRLIASAVADLASF